MLHILKYQGTKFVSLHCNTKNQDLDHQNISSILRSSAGNSISTEWGKRRDGDSTYLWQDQILTVCCNSQSSSVQKNNMLLTRHFSDICFLSLFSPSFSLSHFNNSLRNIKQFYILKLVPLQASIWSNTYINSTWK